MSLSGGFAVPDTGSCRILLHALAFLITTGKIVLRIRLPLLCGGTVPPHRLPAALRYTFAEIVTDSQIELSLGKPLFSRLAIPAESLSLILRENASLPIQRSHEELRTRIPTRRRTTPQSHRRFQRFLILCNAPVREQIA